MFPWTHDDEKTNSTAIEEEEKPSTNKNKNNNNKNAQDSSSSTVAGSLTSSPQTKATAKDQAIPLTNNNNKPSTTTTKTIPKALSKDFLLRSLSSLCADCQQCQPTTNQKTIMTDPWKSHDGMEDASPSEWNNLQTAMMANASSVITPLVAGPMMMTQICQATNEGLLGEYRLLCEFYQVPLNAGIVTTLRFSLPSLRVSGRFHDLDILPLVELLLRHGSRSTLAFLKRLDFTVASKEGKDNDQKKYGFTSHGALALAKALQSTKYIQQAWLPRHRIGPYGAAALFWAAKDNPTIQELNLRRCRIGERGAFAFVELLLNNPNSKSGLLDVDLSSNGFGHRATVAIERALERRSTSSTETTATTPVMLVNLEGNLVFPEIMNGVTHGLGILLSLLGGYLLKIRIQDKDSMPHTVSCLVYVTSLLTLYTSSTLYHSFFTLQNTRYIFQVIDKCAIYIHVGGSYTPFLHIILHDEPIWSVGLLAFIWICGMLGILVEALYPTWKYKSYFSLTMYLGLGWAGLVCLPYTYDRLEQGCFKLLILGGLSYTAGVPFFVRNNNLDHAIWHLFVMMGSMFHFIAVYVYVAPMDLPTAENVCIAGKVCAS